MAVLRKWRRAVHGDGTSLSRLALYTWDFPKQSSLPLVIFQAISAPRQQSRHQGSVQNIVSRKFISALWRTIPLKNILSTKKAFFSINLERQTWFKDVLLLLIGNWITIFLFIIIWTLFYYKTMKTIKTQFCYFYKKYLDLSCCMV